MRSVTKEVFGQFFDAFAPAGQVVANHARVQQAFILNQALNMLKEKYIREVILAYYSYWTPKLMQRGWSKMVRPTLYHYVVL